MTRIFLIAMFAAALFSTSASALVITTIGSGSAVTTVQGSADFESTDALNDNPYTEGGMQFSRTNLTFDNNGCGFAGCVGHPGFVGFSGNYMYGVGTGGYFEIIPSGGVFTGLELIPGTGFFQSDVVVVWEAYNGATLVGSGNLPLSVTSVLGFLDPLGFDRLRFTSTFGSDVADFASTFNAPAFDSVRAQFDRITAVPEPATMALFAAGLLGLGLMSRRRRA